MGSNPLLQRHSSFAEHRGSLFDGDKNVRQRMRSRRTQEMDTQMDLQSARFMEHGISLGMHNAKKNRETKTKEEVRKQNC